MTVWTKADRDVPLVFDSDVFSVEDACCVLSLYRGKMFNINSVMLPNTSLVQVIHIMHMVYKIL